MNFKRFCAMVLTAVIAAAGIVTAHAAAEPLTGGKNVFTAEDFKIDYDSVNGNGAFKCYRIEKSIVEMDGKEVIKLTPTNEAKQPLIDFSYYQWNNSEYLPALDTKEYKFLLIKYKRDAKTTADFGFFKAPEKKLGEAGGEKSFTFKADSTDWDTVIIDLSAQSGFDWELQNIRQLRLYPWGMENADKFTGETIYIEYFGFFKSQTEAEAYGKSPEAEPVKEDPMTAPATADGIGLAAIAVVSAVAALCLTRKKK